MPFGLPNAGGGHSRNIGQLLKPALSRTDTTRVLLALSFASTALATAAAPDAARSRDESASGVANKAPVQLQETRDAHKARSAPAWQSLQKGMSEQGVRSHLGEPGRISSDALGEIWYYPDLTGGSVYFNPEGEVVGWINPS